VFLFFNLVSFRILFWISSWCRLGEHFLSAIQFFHAGLRQYITIREQEICQSNTSTCPGNDCRRKIARYRARISATAILKIVAPSLRRQLYLFLVDPEQIVDHLPAQYRAVRFLERDAIYWGPAPDDTTTSGWATITTAFFTAEALQ
jgi:hypothetical protein